MNFFSKNEVVEMAVKIEQTGYLFYDNAIKRKDMSSKAIELITLLRDEEKVHERTFESLRDMFDLKVMKETISWEEGRGYLNVIVKSHIFNEPESAINLALKAKNEKEIIDYAITFEKDTLLFFHSIIKYVENEKAIKAIEKIIDEEISHVVKLKKIQDAL